MNHTIALVLFITAAVAAAVNLFWELRRCLTMLQQNSYRNERYRRWMKQSGDTTSTANLLGMVAVLASASVFSNEVVGSMMILAASIFGIFRLARMKYKKPLVMTPRARRIYGVMTGISIIVIGVILIIVGHPSLMEALFLTGFTATILFCLSDSLTMLSNLLLAPVEKAINNRYINDARRILASMPDLKIIGITGSYGKTSTKHYLHRILSEKYDTLMTPGSFNTTLGVVRTVREYLKPYNEVFIVEMGAKQPGDIREIAELVHPSVGIVTAVGPQHLESFKTIERVQATKFELVDALPSDGLAIINNDFEQIAIRKVDNVATLRYAVNNIEADWRITAVEYSPMGSSFTLRSPEGREMTFTTHLVGECNISNLAASIVCALYLEVPEEKIRYAVARIEQVEHRLNLKRTPGGVNIIDDAYNSNPVGSAMALDVLSRLKTGKRIVVTPGMIELGDRQEELNGKFGERIAAAADIAIIVNEYNREAIREGALRGGMDAAAIRCVDSFAEAQQLLGTMLKQGDTILYENDLPDTFK